MLISTNNYDRSDGKIERRIEILDYESYILIICVLSIRMDLKILRTGLPIRFNILNIKNRGQLGRLLFITHFWLI